MLIVLVAWTIISFWFFLSTMGYKYRKEKWYDYPLLIPVIVVAKIATVVSTFFGWNK
jgi:hypothetical protein